MEIKIGITQSNRELSVSLDESTDEETFLERIMAEVANEAVVKFAELDGRTLLIPSANIAYIEVKTKPTRTVGFGGL